MSSDCFVTHLPDRSLVTPESRARRVSQVVRATLASRDSTSRAEWLQAPLLALRRAQFHTTLSSRSPSSAFLQASSDRRTWPYSELSRMARVHDTCRQR